MLPIFAAMTAFFSNLWSFISGPFFERTVFILEAPIRNPNMLWMLLPLLGTVIFMEFYLGRYKEEELGWNTAVGNALLLIFVSIDAFRHIFEPLGIPITQALTSGHIKIVISLVLFAFALVLLFVDFFHFIPKKVAYAISSPAYINILAMLGIMIVYSVRIPLDWLTLGSCAAIIVAFTGLGELLYLIIPSYHSPLQRILTVDDVEAFGVTGDAEKMIKNEKKEKIVLKN